MNDTPDTTGPEDEPVYVISVAARLAEMPAWFLRVLDDEGIVVPVRTDSNRRLYSARDLTRLARVRHLTDVRGVNINGIKVIFELEAAWQAAQKTESTAATEAPDTSTFYSDPVEPTPAAVRDVLALLPAYSDNEIKK